MHRAYRNIIPSCIRHIYIITYSCIYCKPSNCFIINLLENDTLRQNKNLFKIFFNKKDVGG
jgi:hypothetical protein